MVEKISEVPEYDHVGLKTIEAITSKLGENERIMFTSEILKVNRLGLKNDRILLLTNHRLINVQIKPQRCETDTDIID